MKLLKKLAIFISAIALCIGASACMGGDNASSSSSVASNSVVSSEAESSVASSSVEESSVESSAELPATAYTFIVLNADGTPAANVQVQLCMLGNSAACFMPMPTNENGIVEYTAMGFPGEGEYEIHLLDASYAPLEFNGPVSTPTVYSTITLTLK